MNILKQFPEDLDNRSVYKLTNSQNAQKMSAAAGSVLTPDKWVIFEDEDIKTGEIRKVLVIEAQGEIFATVSKTFLDNFEKAVNFFDGNVGQIEVISGTSKGGRDFITCGIV